MSRSAVQSKLSNTAAVIIRLILSHLNTVMQQGVAYTQFIRKPVPKYNIIVYIIGLQ